MLRMVKLAAGLFFGGAGVYAYTSSEASKNRNAYLLALQNLSNTSGNVASGQTEQISSRLDTGDLIFIMYDYKGCTTALDYIKCWWMGLGKIPMDFDSFGVAYKAHSEPIIVYNQFSLTRWLPYREFIAQPFIRQIVVQECQLNK